MRAGFLNFSVRSVISVVQLFPIPFFGFWRHEVIHIASQLIVRSDRF
jgi:hypothetical protein